MLLNPSSEQLVPEYYGLSQWPVDQGTGESWQSRKPGVLCCPKFQLSGGEVSSAEAAN